MDTQALRAEHAAIMVLASRLGGAAGDVKTRGDAHDAHGLIAAINGLLEGHLAEEDNHLYPALMAADDAPTRELGAAAYEAMGGLVGAWTGYRDGWTIEAILGDVRRFAAATHGVIGALSLRIEMENDVLYPAMDRVTGAVGRSAA